MKKTKHYKGHRWTNKELKTLMRMWSEEASMDEISKEIGVTRVAILKKTQEMRKNGIPLKRRDAGHPEAMVNKLWTAGEVEYLIRRRNEKATSEEIGSELGRTPNAVDGMIQKLRKENVDVAMRGCGVRKLWNPEALKAVAATIIN